MLIINKVLIILIILRILVNQMRIHRKQVIFKTYQE
jgi:hypothetical protein